MKLCDYGCGQEGKYQFKNGKWCCSENVAKCPYIKNKRKMKHKIFFEIETEEQKRIRIEKHMGIWDSKKRNQAREKTINQWNKEGHKKLHSNIKKEIYKNETYENKKKRYNKIKQAWSKEKRKTRSKNYSLSIDYIIKKYTLFSKIEEMRYNPEVEGEIQVHCKNHNCPNSKEQGGWFTPSKIQLSERIRQLENENGNDGSYFYCCDECKNECPLYYSRGKDPFTEKNYTQEEYQTFREHVLKRDNYICQYCGEQAEHVHHERPQKLEPFFSLDPDYAISVCKDCHYKYCHKDECSTGSLANKICKG